MTTYTSAEVERIYDLQIKFYDNCLSSKELLQGIWFLHARQKIQWRSEKINEL